MHKKSQLFLILSVIALTVYNILPTVFFYARPLKNPITQEQAQDTVSVLIERADRLEKEAQEWLTSYCALIQTKPQSIELQGDNFRLTFTKSEDAARFRHHFPRAGQLIPFIPAQLGLAPQEEMGKEVLVQRRITSHLEKHHFTFGT